jgi:DNA-binding Xre family transcriptional regulator|tara:strand:+ start:6781 stop:7515 length:735 start_codon:yes stop_codon:yes gene_type:complete
LSQLTDVCESLKALLKQQHITYKALAEQLKMSEANIKRMFSLNQFTLARLEQICTVLNISLSDLFLLVEKQKKKISQLTPEQELELVSDVKLILVAACVRDGWSFDEIITHYQIDEFACIQLLAKLDRLKMIELLPNNQYKVLIAQDFQWIPHGPLEQFMTKDGIATFISTPFTEDNSFRFYIRGTYSQTSIDIIKRKLNQLKKEVAQLNQEDATLPLENRQHIGLLLAMRPWELPHFQKLRRV